jgi:hypothetical protein
LTVLLSEVGQRQIEAGWYVQDSWRMTRKLTLTYGLRYELYTPRKEVADRQANFDPTVPRGAVVLAGPDAPCGRALRCTDYKDFAPRMGFAYQVSPKFVVRGAYGFFYDDYAVHGFGGTSGLMYQPPFTWSSSITTPITAPTNRLEDGIPPVITIPVTNGKVLPVAGVLYTTTYQNPYGKNAYVQQRNFTVENQLTKDLALTASYVGNKGTRLMYRSDLNQALPGPGDVQSRRPFPAWPQITSMFHEAQSSYNGLQVKAQQRMAHGFLFLAGYTYAKSMDDGKGEGSVHQSAYNRKADRARSDWDVTHRFVYSSTYELPFGHGKRFASSMGGAGSKLLEGWNINAILQLSSGLPFTPSLATPVANTGTSSRPNRIGSGVLSNRTPNLWFDPTAFTTPALYSFGNDGRNILTGPGTHQIDVNFAKTTYLSKEQTRFLQLRVECFNLFNTPQFNQPNASIGSPTVGTISSAGDPANFTRTSRQIQLALKFYF